MHKCGRHKVSIIFLLLIIDRKHYFLKYISKQRLYFLLANDRKMVKVRSFQCVSIERCQSFKIGLTCTTRFVRDVLILSTKAGWHAHRTKASTHHKSHELHLCPGLTLIRCTPNFDIQHKVSLYCKSKHLLPIFNNKVRVKARGAYSIYPWVGRCGTAPHTLTLFKTNIADFPTHFKTEFRFLIPCLRH